MSTQDKLPLTKEQLEQQKAEIEQKIAEAKVSLASLSGETRQETENTIKTLETEKKDITEALIKKIQEEIASLSGEAKERAEEILKSYEREVWEYQSRYAGENETVAEGTGEGLREMREQVSDQREAISTRELLKGTDTEKNLLTVFELPEMKDNNKTPPEKLNEVLGNVNEIINKVVKVWLQFDTEKDKDLEPFINDVITPSLERYLLELLKGKEGEDNRGNNQLVLALMGKVEIGSLDNIIKSFGNIVQEGTEKIQGGKEMFDSGKAYLRAMGFLQIHKNDLKKANKEEILRNPIKFREFLDKAERRDETKSIYQITRQQLGITFQDEEKSFGITAQEKEELRNTIGKIDVKPSKDTTEKIMKLVEKGNKFVEKVPKYQKSALNLLGALDGPLDMCKKFLGWDVIGDIEKSTFWSGIINFVLGILGFPEGLQGLKRAKYVSKIEKDLGDDEVLSKKRKEQIKNTFTAYFNDTTTKDPNNSLQKIDGFDNVKKIPDPEIKEYFNLDYPLLHTSLKENINIAHINPYILQTIEKSRKIKGFKWKNYCKEEKRVQEGKEEKVWIIDPEKASALETYKTEIITAYLPLITNDLAANAKYLTHLKNNNQTTSEDVADTPQNKILFTIISSLYVQKDNVIDGIEAKVFLPSAFRAEEEQSQTEQIVQQPTNTPETPPSTSNQAEISASSLERYTLEKIIGEESGWKYGAVNKSDGTNNPSVSIGLLQRHKPRAVALLKKLKAADETAFSASMTDPLFVNLDNAGNTSRNDTQVRQFGELMKGEVFQKVMEKQALEDVTRYINKIKQDGVTDNKAIVLYARIYNGGAGFYQKILAEVNDKNNIDQILEAIKKSHYVTTQYAHLNLGQAHEELVASIKQDNIENLA